MTFWSTIAKILPGRIKGVLVQNMIYQDDDDSDEAQSIDLWDKLGAGGDAAQR